MHPSTHIPLHVQMEQQQISISKAGAQIRLSARTAILAAANPKEGRYNTSRSLQENLTIGEALQSRFDLIFVLVDQPDRNADYAIALHIASMHLSDEDRATLLSESTDNNAQTEPFDEPFIRWYLGLCRRKTLDVPDEVAQEIAHNFVYEREQSKSGNHASTTARFVLSSLRLATARALLRRRATAVSVADVQEAQRLMTAARASIPRVTRRPQAETLEEAMTRIYTTVLYRHEDDKESTAMDATRVNAAAPTEPKPICLKFARTTAKESELVDACIRTYEEINVWRYDADSDSVVFLGLHGSL
jgi:DNA replication licensing factor MCM7